MSFPALEKEGRDRRGQNVRNLSGTLWRRSWPTGRMSGKRSLRKNRAFLLGKFIYLLDAYDDVEEDVKNKDYNPFAEKYTMEGFEGEVRQILMMMLAETCREFEKLPIIKYGDILRNILYSGVWCRFEEVSRKRREEREKEQCWIHIAYWEFPRNAIR